MKVILVKDEHEEVSGYALKCPGCGVAHLVSSDTHSLTDTVDNPTIRPAVKVVLEPGKECNFFVSRGVIQFLMSSHHNMAGGQVRLEDI